MQLSDGPPSLNSILALHCTTKVPCSRRLLATLEHVAAPTATRAALDCPSSCNSAAKTTPPSSPRFGSCQLPSTGTPPPAGACCGRRSASGRRAADSSCRAYSCRCASVRSVLVQALQRDGGQVEGGSPGDAEGFGHQRLQPLDAHTVIEVQLLGRILSEISKWSQSTANW